MTDAATPLPAIGKAEVHPPTHIKLLKPWDNYHANQVIAAVPEVLTALDAAGVTYREATEFERHIGGFID